MRDYAELIDSLRELAEDVNDEASRAADAIEELLAMMPLPEAPEEADR